MQQTIQELRPHSKGKYRSLFQHVLANPKCYWFLPLNGEQKTDLYNEGCLQSKQRGIPLRHTWDTALSPNQKWIVAIAKEDATELVNQSRFSGVLPVSKMFLLKQSEIENFQESFCNQCEHRGKRNCYELLAYACIDVTDRTKYGRRIQRR